jgi:beta-lactamase regulating signal transducer with metallopeptidase domain
MIAWALQLVLSASLLMLLVLAVRKPVCSLFGAEWAYALWLLPVLVPLLPPLPSLTPAPVFTVLLPPVGAGAPAEAPTSSGEWLLLLLALWGGGAAFFAIWQQSTYSAFMLHLGPQGRAAVPPSYGGIKVVESDAVEGPVALGIFNRRIVVPVDFGTRYSAAEQRLALDHEFIHHRRLDLLWNWVALGMLSLSWFNPIAHIAFRAFRADQELSCDAAVTRRSPAERHDYALALVKSASQPGLIAACPLNHADFLKRRLKMMKQHRASWGRTLGGAASVVILGLAGLALATPVLAQGGRGEGGQIVVDRGGQHPIISKTEIARLREKCGQDEDSGRGSVVCSDEEARDPEVRAIMDRTMKRVERHVEKVTRKAIDEAKIDERVAEATAAVGRTDHERHGAMARGQVQQLRDHMVGFDADGHREHVRQSLDRAREQLSRIGKGEHEAQIRRALEIAHRQVASVDLAAITHHSLRSAEAGLQVARLSLSPEELVEVRREIADARREADEERREALREAAEARRESVQERREALRQAAEARREAQREAAQARREMAREMSELDRELERELGRNPPTPPRPGRVPPPPPPVC